MDDLTQLPGVGPAKAEAMVEAGFDTFQSILDADYDTLYNVVGAKTDAVIEAAKSYVDNSGEDSVEATLVEVEATESESEAESEEPKIEQPVTLATELNKVTAVDNLDSKLGKIIYHRGRRGRLTKILGDRIIMQVNSTLVNLPRW